MGATDARLAGKLLERFYISTLTRTASVQISFTLSLYGGEGIRYFKTVIGPIIV